ncbi:transporter [Nonlabens spongiae]|uniref:Transporter n=1 Tax=Nonlabens spongiae TaxID=331648 RepID=A0A1W6MP18_9FLAO|nr:TolC family protein [Nonlabens spongiae]ARN79335.1 transporter [Nonlabens spongiae]
MPRRNRVLSFSAILMFFVVCSSLGSTLSRKRVLQNPIATQEVMDTTFISLSEYLGYVKKHHPVVKQAGLVIEQGEAQLLKARGGFDPKIEVDYERKDFKGTEYYDELRGAFKIPTWYGVEFKAGAERNEGAFLDPSLKVPEDGLYSAGVKVSVLQGLVINDRMATLRKAKLFREQTQSERNLLINQILSDATEVYFEWWRAAQERLLFESILENTIIRYEGVVRQVETGYKAAIDSVEAGIAVNNRQLSLEQARLDFVKKRLELSNFLWIDGVPIELRENTFPENELLDNIDASLEIMGQSLDLFTIENHPKILAMQLKMEQLDVDRDLKANKLLPRLDVGVDLLTPEWDNGDSYQLNNYKAQATFSFPIFLRKERGDLALAEIKLQDASFDLLATSIQIENKIKANFNEIDSYSRQNQISDEIVTSSARLLYAEERKFDLGNSSIFLINARENKLIESSEKQLQIIVKLLNAKASLFNSLAIVPENL